MRFRRKSGQKAEMDMTPMIDMSFQLIAFFMFAISFSQNEQDERVMLPDSVLAKPANQPLKHPVTIHLKRTGGVIYGGQEMPAIERLRPYLVNERMVLQGRDREMKDATVVIRADRFAKAGVVQRLIQMCQEEKFEKFALRAQEDIGP